MPTETQNQLITYDCPYHTTSVGCDRSRSSQYVQQASLCHSTYHSEFYDVMTNSGTTTSPRSLHHHNCTTVQSSIPWQTYNYCTLLLLGITWPKLHSHPPSDSPFTEHIKYHPPNSQQCNSPPLPQQYCPQSLMATLT